MPNTKKITQGWVATPKFWKFAHRIFFADFWHIAFFSRTFNIFLKNDLKFQILTMQSLILQ